MCALVRLPTAEEQIDQLHKIHQWATKGEPTDNTGQEGAKNRPTTASTRTRPSTAYSRPQTGLSRPGTGKSYGASFKEEAPEMKRINAQVDYDKLNHGEQLFYSGARTLHPQYEHPKKRLKEYERVKLVEDDPESDVEII